jgi:protein-tyrosine phosphatase
MTLALTAAFNVRDMGGLATADGGRLREGLLWRSDSLHRLDDVDLQAVSGLGLRTVVDLRSAEEVEQMGRVQLPEPTVVLHSVPVFTDIRLLSMPPLADGSAESEAAAMVDLYLQMVHVGGRSLAHAIELLGAEGALPALFHCAAGKDRTGLVAAFILEAVGVDDAAIAEDYGRTTAADARRSAWLAEHEPATATKRDAYPAWLMRSHPETMLSTLERLRATHGSITALLLSLGVQETTIQRLREQLVEHPAD